jgi:hypothetical protein
MPPYLAPPYFSLSRLPVTTKIGLTCFSLMILGALAFSGFVIFNERTGFKTDRTHANFTGPEALSQERQDQLFKESRLPGEKSDRMRYDIIHPHSFLMPILFFILIHLMEMSRAPRALKILIYLTAFLSTVLVIAAPWLVAQGGAWAPVMIAAVVGQLGTYAVMVVVPTAQMWFGSDQAISAVANKS